MTLENWNLEDYFVDFDDLPPYTGPITGLPTEYKVHRINTFVLGNIGREIEICIKTKSEIACVILCLATVDYLAGYYFGHQTKGDNFVTFIDSYFPAKYHEYSNDIYIQLRCGIMHNLSLINPWRDGEKSFRIHLKSSPHLEEEMDEEGYNRINFSLPIFWEDIKRSLVMFGFDVIMKHKELPHIRDNFNKRFNQLDGRGSIILREDN